MTDEERRAAEHDCARLIALYANLNDEARWDEVARMGFDERFRRMWNFYLTSCAGAFEGGNCDVTQITVTRPR